MAGDKEFPSRSFLLYWRANAVSAFGTYIALFALQTLVVLTLQARPGWAVQRMLGHASAAMTLDVYAGLFDDDLDGLADRMDEAHVYSMCTESKNEAKTEKVNVTQIRSATTELG